MFKGSEATESLLITFNDAFDVMNARIPKNGINQKKIARKKGLLYFVLLT